MMDLLVLAPIVFVAGLVAGIGIGIGIVAWARRKTGRIAIAGQLTRDPILHATRIAVRPDGTLTTH